MDAEIIVAGAGPAGSTAARLLAEAGREVLLLDRAAFPRPKTCGGALTPPARALLPAGEVPWRGEVRQLLFRYRSADPLPLGSRDPVSLLVDRREFDHFLLLAAERAGALVRTGQAVRGAILAPKGVRVETDGEGHTGRLLLVADGALGRLGPSLGLGGPRLGLALETEVPEGLGPAEAVIDYGYGGHGYGWFFPKAGFSSFGLGSFNLPPSRVKAEYERLAGEFGFASLPRRGHPVPVAGTARRLALPRAAVLGDAAGLTDPLTGEGIRHAMKSAHLLAEVLLNQPSGRENLLPYADLVEREILRDLRLAGRLGRLFYPLAGRLHRFLGGHPEHREDVLKWLRGELGYETLYREIRRSLFRLFG